MTATPALTTDLQQQVLLLEDDLRARLQADAEREGQWKQEHQRALDKERSAASWVEWRDDRMTQAAVAWVLTSVFVRFCEDNGLVAPVWIAGPEDRRQEALDAQLAYFRERPEDTDREWLQAAIDYLGGLPATRGLVEAHSALHLIAPSGNAVTKLLEFWRDRREDGTLVHDLSDDSLSTRFLGDLYQDLSQYAKETYALLQTPVFVEEFILDQTLEPALKERPLEGFKLIDPTCGSGHFLLGAFDRLLDRWNRQTPGLEIQARVQQTLDTIHGVDLNPFAVAIARFRLTVTALNASGLASLEKAPAFQFHLAVGDSLIHGPDPDVLPGMGDRTAFMPFTYATEDGSLLLTLLEEGRYDVVVGNPPYITVKDKALNKIYRSKFSHVCKGTYALTVPFMAEFFALAKKGDRPGWIGQITSNSFMKREFGTRLIEDFLPNKDLRLVADISGAYIPGHGTPTVIIVGRNQQPVDSTVHAVLGVRSEAERPENPAKGFVWTSIVDHIDTLDWEDGWITITELDRSLLRNHPWSLAGGGAVALRAHLKARAVKTLGEVAPDIGFMAVTREDDAYALGAPAIRRRGIRNELMRPILAGTEVRDWQPNRTHYALCPYDDEANATVDEASLRVLWPIKSFLLNRRALSGSQLEQGLEWWEYSQLNARRYRSARILAFAFVATHNHFVLDRRGALYIRSAPVIRLSGEASDDEFFALLGVLNSSTACFWLKQNSQAKAGTSNTSGGGDRWSPEPWFERYEFTGTTLHEYPLPTKMPANRGRELDKLAKDRAAHSPSVITADDVPTSVTLGAARIATEQFSTRMIAIQEELDWDVYSLYGLVEEDLTYDQNDLPGLALGERAFEIVLARAMAVGDEHTAWFTRHGSTPITEIPKRWPTAYRELVQRRIDLISSHPFVRLLERPEYKRRWAAEPWETRQERALRDWLLDRLENRRFWFDLQGRPLPRSIAQLADDVTREPEIVAVLGLREGRPDVPITQSVIRLLADEAVPFLAAYRCKDSGLRKREAWEQTWALQRREDAGKKVDRIEVPPRYTSADYHKHSYSQARGKLDVPKERFILYPDAGRETDPTPLLGWAGWDHAEQALALSVIIGDREKDGWEDERLVPLVAGLAELQPWVAQWHGEIDPDYGVSLAAFCQEQLTSRAAQVGKTLQELAAWRPAPARRGRRARSSG